MTEVELNLTTLVYGGDALGRLPEDSPQPGLAVFIPCALPGERVRARLAEVKRGHARAELLEILTPSPDRVIPRCPHFYSPLSSQEVDGEGAGVGLMGCGGCHYQHISNARQQTVKAAILREQLERLGGLKDPPIEPVMPSPGPWNYRNHMQFHLTSQGKLGFEALHSTRVIPIRECHLPEAPIDQLWPQLDLEPLLGLERVSLRVGADEEMMLILEGGDAQSFELTIEDLPISVVHLSHDGPQVMAGSDHIVMEVQVLGGVGVVEREGEQSPPDHASGPTPTPTPNPFSRLFRVSAASFFQVNTPQAGTMVDHLLSNLPLSPSTTILEVYCGVGLFSAFLAPRIGRLIGIESSPSTCLDFESNLNEFDNVELYEAAAEQVLPAISLRPDVILVDPPRAGLGPRVLDSLLKLNAPELAYVSCDPATLARDARWLIDGGYHLRQITPFDLFPQTYHIESISFWIK